MPRTLSYTLISLREMLLSSSPFALLTVGVIALAYWWLDPAPPKTVVLATGPAQSAYETFGRRYAQALEREGIHVTLLPSDGSSHNLALIRSGQANVGFVQGGTGDISPDDQENIVSLGSLFVEPLWLFYREARARQQHANGRVEGLSDLRGWRVNVGSAGSGVPRLFSTLLDINHLTDKDLKLSELEQTPATVAFLRGRLDALVFASAPESPMVQMLLQTPGVKLLPFPQGEAYSRRLPYLTPVLMPQGMVDLANNLPSHDVKLVATTTSLLANADTHPAVLQLFAQTATELHGTAGWFSRARQYPNLEHSEVPIAAEAERAIKGGLPFLQRHLPFWLANLIERMWLAMGLIIALALPLSRVVPPLYTFRIRSRVFRWYAQLRDIEQRQEADGAVTADLLREVDALEAKVEQVVVPLSYTDELYALRSNIHLVRKKLLRALEAPTAAQASPDLPEFSKA
ncbi:TAXI family TRAP transporter solute-binding subunit [Hydrogenophaga sp.]|uniref:TAXI family TRAP transporter solute-binding subunit n=1 Tax=Hydrogenophaga sp. TaxID=1904254 RepID=UPI0039195890